MPDAQNSHYFGYFIDFVEQDVRMDDDPFACVVHPLPAHVREQGKVCGGVDETEQNSFGRVRVAGEQVINDGGPVCKGLIRPFNPHVVPRAAGRQ